MYYQHPRNCPPPDGIRSLVQSCETIALTTTPQGLLPPLVYQPTPTTMIEY